ncbi:methionine--tRNA ligase [Phreatobacter sp. AB_2022a]|uniref:methionine--tRNA ligase n=1 Tax=Phreatobacter sp. AB_2022a TaxID=3003134 RepID=UPI00228767FD|nr:methionine--tRNA ligase [Phreatobacter sp. AB_2022a]MCZ0734128.1 methionine--tRNA ligase [Phreatobacter sp. AB_2022a]
MAKALITSALPYINGTKHLGNFAGSLLPADIHARYRRQIGDETLFICATDEHGTPAELAAAAAGQPVADYCREQHDRQAEIYRRFGLSFDHFGRTSSARNHARTQHFFHALDARGFIAERVLDQVYSPADGRFLPDRYIIGTCPHCGFAEARGDQCESCTRPLDPTDLRAPRSALSGSTVLEVRPSRHLFLRQSALADALEGWLGTRRGWPPLASSIARKWLDEGLQDRCITRDLAWGVPVPKPGFEDKVFYVWFDAPIGYIAATEDWAAEAPDRRDWRGWWYAAGNVDYVQFLGKDNVPFHAVSFPATELGSGEPWKTVDVIKAVNWLTYEGGKFSTSRGRGVFLDEALDLLQPDYWRWWLAANAPENHDTDFSFARFATDVNNDLADTFGNLVHRVLSFVAGRFGGIVPAGGAPGDREVRLARQLDGHLSALRSAQEARALRKSANEIRAIWRLANGYLAEAAPWTAIRTELDASALATRVAVNLVACAAAVAWPVIPGTAETVLAAFGLATAPPPLPGTAGEALDRVPGGTQVKIPPVLFARLDGEWVAASRARFSGRAPGAGREA